MADEIRPQSLDEVVGQRHILGEGGLLRRIIESGSIPNLVFYGPSGTGKTTVANIIATRTNRPLHRLNATTASISDIKDIIAQIGTFLAPDGVLLYLDEIQYFNKKQQQSLLEFMGKREDHPHRLHHGKPLFLCIQRLCSAGPPFLNSSPLTAADVLPAVERGVRLRGNGWGPSLSARTGLTAHIAAACGGDVRKAMNAVELPPQLRQKGARETPCHSGGRPDRGPSGLPCGTTGRGTTTTTSPPP